MSIMAVGTRVCQSPLQVSPKGRFAANKSKKAIWRSEMVKEQNGKSAPYVLALASYPPVATASEEKKLAKTQKVKGVGTRRPS